jgi:ADP-heptose:LPS heptosyltransferase
MMQPRAKFQTIFVARSGLLGDTLVAIPALAAIRDVYPRARIVYVGERVPGTRFVNAEEVLGCTDLVDEFLYFHSGGFRLTGLWSLARLAIQTLVRRPAVVIVLELRGRYTRKPRFFRLLGCPVVPAAKDFFAHGRTPEVASQAPVRPISEQLLECMAELGIDARAVPARHPLWSHRQNDLAHLDTWLGAQPGAVNKRLLGLGIWSNMPSKRWPLARYAEVVQRLLVTFPDLFPVVLGGAEERGHGESLVRDWKTGAVAAGRFSIRESACLLSRCTLYLGNDTGTMHLAAAVGTPCVAIFSSRDQPGKWHPAGPAHVVLRRKVPCGGCLLRECGEQQLRCLTEITVDDVYAACVSKLRPPAL